MTNKDQIIKEGKIQRPKREKESEMKRFFHFTLKTSIKVFKRDCSIPTNAFIFSHNKENVLG